MSADPFTIEVLSYVLVTVRVPFTRELAIATARAAKSAADAAGLSRYLIDLRAAPSVVTPLANVGFVHHDMPDLGLDPKALVALLVSPSDHSHDMVVTVMQDHAYRVHLFREERDALGWLEA